MSNAEEVGDSELEEIDSIQCEDSELVELKESEDSVVVKDYEENEYSREEVLLLDEEVGLEVESSERELDWEF